MTVMRYRAQADYHLVFIAPLDAAPILDSQAPTTLLQVVDNGVSLIIFTGIHTGALWVTVSNDEATMREKTGDPAWEERAEARLTVTENLYMSSPTGDFVPQPTRTTGPVPVFVPTHPGPHRVFAFARGKEEERDNSLIEPGPEEHLIVISALPA